MLAMVTMTMMPIGDTVDNMVNTVIKVDTTLIMSTGMEEKTMDPTLMEDMVDQDTTLNGVATEATVTTVTVATVTVATVLLVATGVTTMVATTWIATWVTVTPCNSQLLDLVRQYAACQAWTAGAQPMMVLPVKKRWKMNFNISCGSTQK